MRYTSTMEHKMDAIKDTRVQVRLPAVLRGKLAEEAGPHGTLSNVMRYILEQYFTKKARRS